MAMFAARGDHSQAAGGRHRDEHRADGRAVAQRVGDRLRERLRSPGLSSNGLSTVKVSVRRIERHARGQAAARRESEPRRR